MIEKKYKKKYINISISRLLLLFLCLNYLSTTSAQIFYKGNYSVYTEKETTLFSHTPSLQSNTNYRDGRIYIIKGTEISNLSYIHSSKLVYIQRKEIKGQYAADRNVQVKKTNKLTPQKKSGICQADVILKDTKSETAIYSYKQVVVASIVPSYKHNFPLLPYEEVMENNVVSRHLKAICYSYNHNFKSWFTDFTGIRPPPILSVCPSQPVTDN